MKIRLIDPASEVSLLRHSRRELKTLWFAHLSLTTLAALTPADIDVAITDENVEPIDFDEEVDLVGITGMTIHAPRAYEIARAFRDRGIPVVMGGPHASALPQEAKSHVDSVVIGEAEEVWEQVLSDAGRGNLKPFYKAKGFCSMEGAPRPRIDLLKKKVYFTTSCVQTSRGCPFRCDFCYVTQFFGNTYRCRPVDEVIKEVEALEDDFVVFVDDNITGNPRYAKELFTRLIPLKKKWAGQSSITIAKNDEMLGLAAKSGCVSLFLGIESLSPENLRAVHKSFNKVNEYEESLRKIHDHGIMVLAGLIFGFDHDDEGVFERTVRFCEKTRIEAPCFFVLTPLPGTPFYDRMEAEGRILHRDWSKYTGAEVVYRPKLMTEETLQRGFNWASRTVYSYRSIFKRLAHPQQRFFTRMATNLVFRQVSRRKPKTRLSRAAKIIRNLNTSLPVRDRQTLTPTLGWLTLERGQQAVRGITEALNVHVTRNERLNTLFVRLEGSMDLRAAEEFIARIKKATDWVQDRLVIDFDGIQFFSRKAIHLMFEENYQKLIELRGRLRIVNLSSQIPDITESMRRYISEIEFNDDSIPTPQAT
ncbi:MAG: radical SAM protein [Deltaproteobacteria bacterium]|nr:radical SAM protein [Deltaproteobacteria bacterium]